MYCSFIPVQYMYFVPLSLPSPPVLFFFLIMQLIASEQKNVDFLLSLCDFAILRGFPQLRDSVRNLLKLLPTGQLYMYMYMLLDVLCTLICVVIYMTYVLVLAVLVDSCMCMD